MTTRPRIAITTRADLVNRRFYLGRDYAEALVAAGATPVMVPLIPDREYILDLMQAIDGVLLPGSDTDVDPLRYGLQPHPRLGTVVPEKDETDQLVLELAESMALPVFAICYGMQALNVFHGGSLVQDIESQVDGAIKHQQGLPLDRRSHEVSTASGSILETILGVVPGTVHVNSHHHQAISKLGKDLRISAVAADGVVEAVESTDEKRFIFGAQWHPEIDWRNDPLSQALFRSFVDACTHRSSDNAEKERTWRTGV